jgi:hypothetical protein
MSVVSARNNPAYVLSQEGSMARATRTRKPHPKALLSVRTALVLLLGVLAGVGAAVLTLLAGHNLAEAVGAGTAGVVVGTRFFQQLIE